MKIVENIIRAITCRMSEVSYGTREYDFLSRLKDEIHLDIQREAEVKNLAQPDVSGSNCHHKNRTHVHHVGSYFEPKYGALYERCEDCGEKLNLIEYGDARGRTKWWQ